MTKNINYINLIFIFNQLLKYTLWNKFNLGLPVKDKKFGILINIEFTRVNLKFWLDVPKEPKTLHLIYLLPNLCFAGKPVQVDVKISILNIRSIKETELVWKLILQLMTVLSAITISVVIHSGHLLSPVLDWLPHTSAKPDTRPAHCSR